MAESDMNKIREILNELKWNQKNLEDVEIWYIHRGAQNNTKIITGKEIISIDKTFLQTNDATIPHHRIFKIKLNNTILFDRKKI
jgi:uncharacterized protein (UPF0248 family)